MRNPAFCICENKDAADLRLCFRYTHSTIPLLPYSEINFKHPAIFCSCTARFVSDLVGNPEAMFSRDAVHLTIDQNIL